MSDPTQRELWLIGQVMEHLGVATASGARTFLRRAGIRAMDYIAGDSGRPEARYDAAQIREAEANRPGQGARTDLGKDDCPPHA